MKSSFSAQYRKLYHHHWWWRAREEYVLYWLRRLHHGAAGLEILDVGCGDGLLFEPLGSYGNVSGVEPDATLLSPDSPWQHRIRVCPFGPDFHDDNRYDLIVMLDVLEHIENDHDTMLRVATLLQAGGLVLLTVPALPLLWSTHDTANHHYRRYTLKSLRQCLKSTPLRILHMQYFYAWTILPMLARKLISGDENVAQEYMVTIPPLLVNRLMHGLSRLEQWVSRRGWLPLGSSIFAALSADSGTTLVH